MKIILYILIATMLFSCQSQHNEFKSKKYHPVAVPTFEASKHLLPQPILFENSEWLDLYWFSWQTAFKGLKQPQKGSPLVSNWLDEAFSDNIFQWDTIFMMMFARYGHTAFPAIQSLDNFYALQYANGFIGREYRESDGALIHFDFEGGLFSSSGFKNTINPPLFSWAEVESYRLTGDKSRFEKVLTVLEKYANWLNQPGDPDASRWLENGRKSVGTPHELYWNTPLGSGMDNTPRPAAKGAGWVEMSSQMVIMYNHLAIMAESLFLPDKAERFRQVASGISARINQWCWSEEDGFYYDVDAKGQQFRKKTSGGFWPLMAGIASDEQASRLVAHLQDSTEFWRLIPFPTLAADEPEYRSDGGYWLGGVWAPTNVMIIKGLEQYGYHEFAAQAAEKYLAGMAAVYDSTQTLWENYAPDTFQPGNPAKPDFVGWSGCGPIQLLIENVMGFHPDGANRVLTWQLRREDRHGIENLLLGENHVSVVYNGDGQVSVQCIQPFELKIVRKGKTDSHYLTAGDHVITVSQSD